MALNRYVLTADVSLPAPSGASFTLDAATGLRFGTGSYASAAGTYGSGAGSAGGGPVLLKKGMVLMLDPAGAAFTAIGAGNLRAFIDGTDTAGREGISN